MFTYLIYNLLFLIVVLLVLRLCTRQLLSRPVLFTLVILLVLTTLFDSLIIAAGIVGYTEEHLLGLFIGLAPVEDFLYAVLAGIAIPALWHIAGKSSKKDKPSV